MAAVHLDLPWVMIHQASSLDGNLTGFDVDPSLYYGVAEQLEENATLSSALSLCKPGVDIEPETEEDKGALEVEDDDKRPVCVITDSKGRVRNWHVLKKAGIWKDFIALVSASTPEEYLAYLTERHIKYIKTGESQADLKEALQTLRKDFGIRRLRVDGCTALNGALLSAGLVDEISLLVSPTFTATASPLFSTDSIQSAAPTLKLVNALEAGASGYVWLRYLVVKS